MKKICCLLLCCVMITCFISCTEEPPQAYEAYVPLLVNYKQNEYYEPYWKDLVNLWPKTEGEHMQDENERWAPWEYYTTYENMPLFKTFTVGGETYHAFYHGDGRYKCNSRDIFFDVYADKSLKLYTNNEADFQAKGSFTLEEAVSLATDFLVDEGFDTEMYKLVLQYEDVSVYGGYRIEFSRIVGELHTNIHFGINKAGEISFLSYDVGVNNTPEELRQIDTEKAKATVESVVQEIAENMLRDKEKLVGIYPDMEIVSFEAKPTSVLRVTKNGQKCIQVSGYINWKGVYDWSGTPEVDEQMECYLFFVPV